MRQRWSLLSERKSTFDLWKNDDFPRFRFDKMTSSKSLIEGSSERVLSRSWINSLKPAEVSMWLANTTTVRTLSLLEHLNVLQVLMWQALDEFVHLEMVEQTRLLLVTAGGAHVSPVCIQKARKASYKRRSDLIGAECRGAYYAYSVGASRMGMSTAAFEVLA